MVGFIFGSKDKDKPWTYEELQRKREIAETLAAGNLRTPQNVGEGLASIGRALMYRKLDKKASAEEARLKSEFDAKWGSVFGGYGGGGAAYAGGGGGGSPSGTWTPDAPAPDAVDLATQGFDVAKKGGLSFGAGTPKADPGVMGAQGGLDFGAAVMTPQEMLIEGAKARGLDPIDVATAISYETGGKFDPMISGPTTQWGTHRGLIQFGEPQAQHHGVDFSSPDAAWRSQLNPESGAIWNYLEGAGVRPGMGLDQIYSAINAGSVGRMGASDANNGGAPGTVADKVASMGPHRQKAAQFLGGTWTPNPDAGGAIPSGGVAFADASGGFPGGMDIGALVGLASDPMASPAQKAIIETLIQQQLQAADPLRAMQMEREQLELEALRNPTAQQPEELTNRTALLAAAGVDPASPEGQHYLLTGKMPDPPDPGYTMIGPEDAKAMGLPPGVYQKSADGKITEVGGGGQTINVSTGSEVGTIPQGFELFTDPATGARSMRPIPGGPEDMSKKDAAKASGTAVASDIITTATDRAMQADESRLVGGLLGAAAAYNPSSNNAEVYRQVEVLTANAKVENLQAMRNESPTGGALGSVTEKETQMLADQAGALDPASPNFKRDLLDYTRNLLRVIHGNEAGDAIFNQKYGGGAASGANDLGLTEDDLKYLE